jgi:hypothetical protein
MDLTHFENFIIQLKKQSIELDDTGVGFLAGYRINWLVNRLNISLEDVIILENLVEMFNAQDKIPINYEYWNAHKILHQIIQKEITNIRKEAIEGKPKAGILMDLYKKLAEALGSRTVMFDEV